MSGFDGNAESEAILVQLKTLAGGRVFEGGPPDYEQLPKDGNGKIRPYVVVLFGQPIPNDIEATLGPIIEQPFQMPCIIQWVAGDAGDLRRLAAAGTNLLLDWKPTPSAAPLRPMNGGEFTTRDTQDRPTRYTRVAHWPVGINFSRR